jgi:hypothetical protein
MTKDKGIRQRRAVAHRLEGFFAEWLGQLSAGSAKIWARVERGVTGKAEAPGEPPESPNESAPPVMRVPMQQQPVQQQPMQQQQQKTEE